MTSKVSETATARVLQETMRINKWNTNEYEILVLWSGPGNDNNKFTPADIEIWLQIKRNTINYERDGIVKGDVSVEGLTYPLSYHAELGDGSKLAIPSDTQNRNAILRPEHLQPRIKLADVHVKYGKEKTIKARLGAPEQRLLRYATVLRLHSLIFASNADMLANFSKIFNPSLKPADMVEGDSISMGRCTDEYDKYRIGILPRTVLWPADKNFHEAMDKLKHIPADKYQFLSILAAVYYNSKVKSYMVNFKEMEYSDWMDLVKRFNFLENKIEMIIDKDKDIEGGTKTKNLPKKQGNNNLNKVNLWPQKTPSKTKTSKNRVDLSKIKQKPLTQYEVCYQYLNCGTKHTTGRPQANVTFYLNKPPNEFNKLPYGLADAKQNKNIERIIGEDLPNDIFKNTYRNVSNILLTPLVKQQKVGDKEGSLNKYAETLVGKNLSELFQTSSNIYIFQSKNTQFANDLEIWTMSNDCMVKIANIHVKNITKGGARVGTDQSFKVRRGVIDYLYWLMNNTPANKNDLGNLFLSLMTESNLTDLQMNLPRPDVLFAAIRERLSVDQTKFHVMNIMALVKYDKDIKNVEIRYILEGDTKYVENLNVSFVNNVSIKQF